MSGQMTSLAYQLSFGSQSSQRPVYFFICHGVPSQLRTFQAMKDHVRKPLHGRHSPGWVDIHKTNIATFPLGCKDNCAFDPRACKEDADAVYNFLCREKPRMMVHLFETNIGDTSQYRLLKCNCLQHTGFQHTPGMDKQLWDVYYAVPAQPAYYPVCYPMQPAAPVVSLYPPTIPVFMTPQNGVPVNVAHGAVRTEACGIFVQNLSRSMTPSEFGDMIRKVGNPVSVELVYHKDGRPSGKGKAQFGSSREAQEAIRELKRSREYRGLEVRADTDRTTVSRSPPIANGSIRSQN